jgi:protein-tyrosine phosphatase/1-acyl-sn-glycerol-3-phosphate acyltransferase/membrane-associated phospholipid phosphatase
MTGLAARRSAQLSLLFLLVYGGCIWLTAGRADVGEWYYAWERGIPFWPIMAVPYLSIDAFFVAAPFLFRDRDELRIYTRRVTAAIVAAGVCFVLVPLRFAFERPPAAGWAGAMLEAFTALDRPHNLFPSLHVALGVILGDVYLRRTTGLLRAACAAWFVLIGLSTLFTYQHHVVDVAGGLGLAVLVFYAVRERRQGSPEGLDYTSARFEASRNLRVASFYLLGAATATGLAILAWPLGVILFWPAASLLLVGCAYLGAGPAVFRKSNGRIPIATRVVLGPCLAGQWLSLAYYRRQCRPFDEITPHLWIGRRLDAAEAAAAVERGVTAVLDLSAELAEADAFTRVAYRNVPVVDLTAPTGRQLEEAVAFIARHAASGVVYVHCKIGYSRSAAVAAAYLLASGRARTSEHAIAIIRRARPSIVVRPEAVAALRSYEAVLQTGDARDVRRPFHAAFAAAVLAAAARALCGPARWQESQPCARQRIYFANHGSHLDCPAVWASLPPDVRAATRPVAGRDYWDRGALRRYVARQVFRAVLVDRRDADAETSRDAVVDLARRNVERAARALATGASLIIFPEGTRGDGVDIAPFKSGLYHLCRLRPDVELVPVFLENMHRILPKGEALPVPVIGSVTFGRPLRLRAGEEKHAFLARARRALVEVYQPCRSSPTLHSRAS